MKQLKLNFSKQLPADIWEQHLSDQRLLLSMRDSVSMGVSFSLLDLVSGEFIFAGLAFEEDWWVSVYHFFEDIAVFQVFEDTQNIEARSYFALDLNTQEAIWSLDEVTTIGRHDHFLQMKTFEDDALSFWLDIRSGETMENLPEKYPLKDIPDAVLSPLHYTEETPHLATVQGFLKQKLDLEAVKACDYLEYSGLAFVGYHTQGPGGFDHFVLVLSETGEILLHEKRDKGLKGLISGSFFIAGERLIFVSGKRTLNSYLIR